MLILFHLLIVFHWRVLSYKIIHLCQQNILYYQVEIVYSFYIDLPILNTLSFGTYSFFAITSISLSSISHSFHYIKIFHFLLVLILIVLDHSIPSLPLLLLQILVLFLYFFSSSDSFQLKNQIISQLNPISCYGSLTISSDSDCNKLYQNGWTSITVNEGYCNSITTNLIISDYSCLETLYFKTNSLKNLNSVVIKDNPLLRHISVYSGDGGWSGNDSRNTGTFYYVKSVTLSSIF